ncbi:hypothetical protein EDD53_1802 [Pacificibacter maritimus]|uniref:Uncharacterized protein n=1 Tax=Pacificibacter maritimus TaxID=762213 RepID=A0A3N4V376_9RHOB|nr:hypothetical protein EDD53_1802 [Pacificibacter maritimus]
MRRGLLQAALQTPDLQNRNASPPFLSSFFRAAALLHLANGRHGTVYVALTQTFAVPNLEVGSADFAGVQAPYFNTHSQPTDIQLSPPVGL